MGSILKKNMIHVFIIINCYVIFKINGYKANLIRKIKLFGIKFIPTLYGSVSTWKIIFFMKESNVHHERLSSNTTFEPFF